MESRFTRNRIEHEFNVDSKGLYDSITTLHDGREYRLRQTVQLICDSFESEKLNRLKWIQGFPNIVDALTKRGSTYFRLISTVFRNGRLDLPKHQLIQWTAQSGNKKRGGGRELVIERGYAHVHSSMYGVIRVR